MVGYMRSIIIGLVLKSVALHRHSDSSSLGEVGNRGFRDGVVVLRSRAGSGSTGGGNSGGGGSGGRGVAVGTPMGGMTLNAGLE